MTKEEIDKIIASIINGASFVLDQSICFFLKGNWELPISSIRRIPVAPENLNIGLEIGFNNDVEDFPQLVIPFNCFKTNYEGTFLSNCNTYKLDATSSTWNRLLGIHSFNSFGIEIYDTNNNFLQLGEETDEFIPANFNISIPPNFNINGIRIYFFNDNGNTKTFIEPHYILRILGIIIREYYDLLGVAYQRSPENNSRVFNTNEYIMGDLFGLLDFINYYDNIEVAETDSAEGIIERKKFVQRILKFEYEFHEDLNIAYDTNIDFLLLDRIDSIFEPGKPQKINHLKTDLEHLKASFQNIVSGSPEKCFIAELTEIKDAYIAIFDAEFYQFDQVDITSNDKDFTELTDPALNRNCKALINGSFWGLREIEEPEIFAFGVPVGTTIVKVSQKMKIPGTIAEWIGGAVMHRKANPQGNYIFRESINGVQKRWKPGDVIESDDAISGRGKKIVEEQKYPGKCFFYQTNFDEIVFGKDKLPDATSQIEIPPSPVRLMVGVDNLVGWRVNNIDLIGDPIHGKASKKFITSSGNPEPEKTSNGFPLFGTINRNNRKYLYFLVAEDPGWGSDDGYNGRPDIAFNFLKEMGAENILFTDGASSSGLIYNNQNIIEPARNDVKNRLISTAIGIQPKQGFSELVVISSETALGGSKEYLNHRISTSTLTVDEKNILFAGIIAKRAMPFIDHQESQHINSDFGGRVIDGVWGFHEGVDIRAQTPLNIKVNARGKIFRIQQGNGYGKHIILNHGRDLNRNYYFTIYAHLSNNQMHALNSIVEKNSILAISGETDAIGSPHLHFELLVVNKRIEDITFADLTKRINNRDPENFILPDNLIID
jgi:murein DD-endopeptidase MepM/ murein hydrolase activator NlpD